MHTLLYPCILFTAAVVFSDTLTLKAESSPGIQKASTHHTASLHSLVLALCVCVCVSLLQRMALGRFNLSIEEMNIGSGDLPNYVLKQIIAGG